MKAILLALALVGCSTVSKHEPEAIAFDKIKALQAKYDLKNAEVQLAPGSNWPSLTDCDATLWAGETAAAGFMVDLHLAEHAPGEIHRRPVAPCWTKEEGDVGSKSTISSDMILGYMLGLWKQGDLEAMQRLADYGDAHDWVMGEPISELGRVYLKSNLQGTLGRMIYALSAEKDDREIRKITHLSAPGGADFEKHLLVLGIYLDGEVSGEINDNDKAALSAVALEAPANYFFGAVRGIYTGEFDYVFDLLLDDSAPVPSYVRGDDAATYALIHWLLSAKIVLDSYGLQVVD